MLLNFWCPILYWPSRFLVSVKAGVLIVSQPFFLTNSKGLSVQASLTRQHDIVECSKFERKRFQQNISTLNEKRAFLRSDLTNLPVGCKEAPVWAMLQNLWFLLLVWSPHEKQGRGKSPRFGKQMSWTRENSSIKMSSRAFDNFSWLYLLVKVCHCSQLSTKHFFHSTLAYSEFFNHFIFSKEPKNFFPVLAASLDPSTTDFNSLNEKIVIVVPFDVFVTHVFSSNTPLSSLWIPALQTFHTSEPHFLPPSDLSFSRPPY